MEVTAFFEKVFYLQPTPFFLFVNNFFLKSKI